MQNRSMIVLGLAILLGLAAVFVANSYLSSVEEQAEPIDNTLVGVAVPRVALEYGTTITEDKIRFVNLPRRSLPEGTFPTTKDLINPAQPRVALRPIAINEPIMASKISGPGGRATISAILREDMRAVAVRVSDVRGVAGFVMPGDSVDVFITRTPEGEQGRDLTPITDVLLQNVRVIAIDQNANDDASQPKVSKTATLEVNQIDAQKLVLAEAVGALSLALRKVEEQDNPTVQTVSVEDLRDGAYGGNYRSPGPQARYADNTPAYRARRTRPKTRILANSDTVEIIRGTGSKTYEVKRHVGN